MKSTEGIRHLTSLRVGYPELSHLQLTVSERQRRALVAEFGGNLPALLVPSRAGGGLGTAWQVHDDDNDGAIAVRVSDGLFDGSGRAFLASADGDVAELVDGDAVNTSGAFVSEITLTDDNTWRTVLARVVTTTYGPGTIALTTGSKNVTGTGTRFTEHAGKTTDGIGRGTKIRIASGESANGNAGTYEIDVVTDDGTIVLLTNALGTTESGLRYRFAGAFLTAAPTDSDVYRRNVVELSVVARTRTAPAGYVILADVRRNSASSPQVSVIDRRRVPRGIHSRPTWPRFLPILTADGTDVDNVLRSAVDLSASSFRRVHDVATCADGSLLLLYSTATDNLLAARWDPKAGWQAGVNVTTGATNLGAGATIVRLPSGTGWTHRVVYRDNAVIQTRTTSDNGATWSSASTIWTPASADASDTVAGEGHLVLLHNGRLVYADRYHDHSVSTTTTEHAVHFIWSDDYGSSWSTNSNAGTLLLPMDGGNHFARPRVVQVPDGRIYTLAVELSTSGDELVYVRSDTSATPTPDDAANDYKTIGGLALGGPGDCAADVNASGVITLWTPILATQYYEHLIQLRPSTSAPLELAVGNRETGWFMVGTAGTAFQGVAGVRDRRGDWRAFHAFSPASGDDELREVPRAIVEQAIPNEEGPAF